MAKSGKESTFGERLRTRRIAKGISAKELDRRSGLHEGHVAMIERGDRKNPNGETVVKLARALECDLVWLLTGDKHEDKEYERYRSAKLRRQAAK